MATHNSVRLVGYLLGEDQQLQMNGQKGGRKDIH